MRDHENSIAKKVHELLLNAHPQRGNPDLAAALASAEVSKPSSDVHRIQVVAAIQKLKQAIEERASAAHVEQLLLQAIAAAQHWVTSTS